MITVLVEITGYDPVAGAAVTLRATNQNDDRVCHLNGQTWSPAISKEPALRYDLFDGAFAGRIASPTSSLVLAVEAWPDFARYMLTDASLKLWTGTAGDAWGSYTLRFDGRVSAQPAVSSGLATIPFGVDDRWLDKPLLSNYAGTTGIEGPSSLKGQVKPLSLGAPRFVPGVLIDSVNNVVQVSSYGLIEDVEVAMERLARFPAPVADYATYAALIAATIAPGFVATCKAQGLVRHGAPPVGKLSYHVKGDKAGAGGWVRLPGALINRIAVLGGGTGKIDAASLTALDAARPWNLSIYVDAQTTARDLIQRIAASVNAVALVTWLGKLVVVPIGFGTPSMTLDATGAALPPTAPLEQLAIDAPFWRLAIQAVRTWNVHELNEVAFTANLIDRGLYDDAESYREGHVVSLGDGSTFLYVNTTPSTGNDPPTPTSPPTAPASNTWWTQLSPPLVALSGQLTNAVHVVTANSAGVVQSYAGAGGVFEIFDAGSNVSSNFALSTLANPQGLTVGYVGQTYAVTAGLDAGEPSATLTIRATGSGPYAGRSIDRVFSLGKAVAGMAGVYRDVKFKRSLLQPTAPATADPSDWSDGVPAGTETLWMTVADKDATGALIDDWSPPESISGLTPRGQYQAGTTYYLHNSVTFSGGTYVAVQDNFSGQAPTGTAQANAYWDVVAAPGEPGAPATPPSAFSATINLVSGAAVNLRTVADANGYTGLSDATITFKVQSGVTIRGLGSTQNSGAAGGYGIDTGSWPTSDYTITLTLIVESGGIVDGGGGGGGIGSGQAGSAGGDAVYCRVPITITINSGGTVRSGGGGAGGGARYNTGGSPEDRELVGGGGGGGGAPNGSGGTGTNGNTGVGSTGGDGNFGTTSGGGTGGAAGSVSGPTRSGGAGGTGGTYGAAGANGGNASGGITATGGTGGPAGYAVRKNGFTVPVTNNGTMTGTAA